MGSQLPIFTDLLLLTFINIYYWKKLGPSSKMSCDTSFSRHPQEQNFVLKRSSWARWKHNHIEKGKYFFSLK